MFSVKDGLLGGEILAGGLFSLVSNSKKRKAARKDISQTGKDMKDQETLRQGAAGIRSDQPQKFISDEMSRATKKVNDSKSKFGSIYDSIFG